MNRQGFASLGISPRHLQQGLFTSLALVMTLIGGQQWAHWQQPAAEPSMPAHASIAQQSHFSAIRSTALNANTPSARYDLAASEDTQTADSQPEPERWVF
ncbi:hypothetical protein NTD86_00630 [Pseudomonas sp. 7P_10.2_Bac1]|uniref:hypothetical protein n=1 Tax=Pseudomonas sp. 7P_10.2_Bac1 TaxID=2971614 RepID=UPI0021C68206|nr:hypothetical protein [Pseudomonas sp. 7P_10.2_Bac1]MCU1725489.1 hypothetical protein [Pseudomonas sp. 7P_10.2_Bac1]